MIQEKEHKGVVFSCEVFPPKRDDDIYQIYKTLDEIKTLKPDFISVTYGAGGSNSKKTATIAAYIQNICEVEALAHMTAVGMDEASLRALLFELKRKAWRIFWHCVAISREQCHRRNSTSVILSMQPI